jgi:peptidyl-prolyl cis-trans isomerase SurA
MIMTSNYVGMPMQLVVRLLGRLSAQLSAIGCGLALAMGLFGATAPAAHAQSVSVIATVNDDPITDYDVAERMKLDKVLHRPVTRDAAIEDIITDRLKIGETMKYKIEPTDQQIGGALAVTANQMKMQPQQLAAELQSAGVDAQHWHEHWKAEWVWGAYVRALNKMLDVSESDVRAEIAKEGNKAGSDDEYTLRQVILTVPGNASAAEIETRMREATQLRARFTDCPAGAQLASAIQDVAVQQPTTRTASGLNDQFRDLISNTPIGHLTPPSRGPDGIEMIAVCDKSATHDDSERNTTVHDMLLSQHLEDASSKLFKDVRARAVIVMKH